MRRFFKILYTSCGVLHNQKKSVMLSAEFFNASVPAQCFDILIKLPEKQHQVDYKN